jgi:hypothetical protein
MNSSTAKALRPKSPTWVSVARSDSVAAVGSRAQPLPCSFPCDGSRSAWSPRRSLQRRAPTKPSPPAAPAAPLASSSTAQAVNASGSTSRGAGVRNGAVADARSRAGRPSPERNQEVQDYRKPPSEAKAVTEPVVATQRSGWLGPSRELPSAGCAHDRAARDHCQRDEDQAPANQLAASQEKRSEHDRPEHSRTD